jgi:hypothetical protein
MPLQLPQREARHTALITVIRFLNCEKIIIKELNAEVCDATKVNQGTEVGNTIINYK